ncbi:hypothetical protein RCO28_38805 [Streptomyces sp. LHD-70]|uniref:hypothetical protein n=1 Tax=Streptomyces sp. LHD-70 TaxID=3072140 RepID=UPI00280CF951|nr:hypothetical protein [Streptomyces sp. LHD-70]MDQ8708366.1 hypothetical protein [Streptomyces sp. LHD-70]
MESATPLLMPLLLIGAMAVVLALIVWTFIDFRREHVGTRALRKQRQYDMMHAFDGRPEVVVRYSGSGMSIEEIVWYGRQRGYDLYCLQGTGQSARHLVMRRLPQPWPPPPALQQVPPRPEDLAAIRADVYRTINPEGMWVLVGALIAGAAGVGSSTIDTYRAQEGIPTGPVVTAVLLLLALGVALLGRRALKRRSRRFTPTGSQTNTPPAGQAGGTQ